MSRLSRQRWRVVLTTATVMAVTLGTMGGVASADIIDDLTAEAEAQFELLEDSAGEDGALGVFRNGTDNVVMIPAEKAGEIDTLQDLLETQVDGVLDEIRVSQFTTDALDALSEELGSPEAIGIADDYGYVQSYDAETDTWNIMTDAPESTIDQAIAAHPGQVSSSWGQVTATHRFNDTNPFYGAGALAVGDTVCTGFVGLKDDDGNDYMLTAAHCYGMWSQVKNQGGAFMGYVYDRKPTRDIALIWDESGSTQYEPRIWTGGTADSESWISVGGQANPRLGTRGLYGSGRTTYLRTRGQITKTKMNFCLPKQRPCVDGESGFGFSGGTASKPGDSGMPIFTLTSDNKARIIGMLSGNVIDANGKTTDLGVSLSSILNSYVGLSLMTQ